MKKIAFFIPDMSGGGAERTVLNLLKEWKDLPYHLDLVLVKAEGVYLGNVPGRVNIVDLHKKRTFSAIIPLSVYLRRNRPAVLIAHLSHANTIALLAKKIAGVDTPLVLVEHAILPPSSFPRKQWWLQWGMKKLYPSAAAIVAVAETTARDLEQRLGLREGCVNSIYNPVITQELSAKLKMPVPHPWLEEKGIPVFLGVGRLVPEKDFATLLEAFALVRKQRPARLMILGEGILRETMERQIHSLGIEQDTFMPGFVENPFTYMAHCDAFVLSSLREGLSNVLIEAMACGCPVIATDCTGAPAEVLNNGEFGTLVPVGDIVSLAAAMTKAVSSPDHGRKGIQRAAYFSAERAASAYQDLLGRKIFSPPGATVIHLITGLGTGGAEQMLCNLLSGMDKKERQPVVVSLAGNKGEKVDGTPAGRLAAMGIPVHFMGMQPGKLPSPEKMWKLIQLVRRLRPRLIHGWMYHGNLAAQFISFLFPRIEIIWSIHYSLDAWEKEKWMTKKMIRLGARLSGRPDRIIYVSQVSRRQHAAIGYEDKKAVLIPNGVDPLVFTPSAEARAAVRRELEIAQVQTFLSGPDAGMQSPDFLIGLLARYHPMKDHENFLRAAALLLARHPNTHFVLAGKNIDRNNSKITDLIGSLEIGHRVYLLGERTDSHRLLPALDLFSLTSAYAEAFPMVLLEAMSSGLPCVTTHVGDSAQIVGNTGLVVPPGDPFSLADAWDSLIREGAEKRRALGEAAREKIINSYSLSWVISAYEKLYEEVAKGNRGVTAANAGKVSI